MIYISESGFTNPVSAIPTAAAPPEVTSPPSSLKTCTVSVLEELARKRPHGEKERLRRDRSHFGWPKRILQQTRIIRPISDAVNRRLPSVENQNGNKIVGVPVDVNCALEAAAQLVGAGAAVVDVEDADDGALLGRGGDAPAAGREGDCHQGRRVRRNHRLRGLRRRGEQFSFLAPFYST